MYCKKSSIKNSVIKYDYKGQFQEDDTSDTNNDNNDNNNDDNVPDDQKQNDENEVVNPENPIKKLTEIIKYHLNPKVIFFII